MEVETEVAVKAPHQDTLAALRNQYLWWICVAASLVLVAIIYRPTMGVWWQTWWKPESLYSHGVLVPAISAFIIYMDRARLSTIPIAPSPALGIPGLLITMAVSYAFRSIGSGAMEGFTLPLFLISASLLLFGWQMTRALLFPLLFLFFMCPFPESILSGINIKIQLLSTVFATKSMQLMQIDAAHVGTTIYMPNATVTVGAPCSGFRMLISLFAFSTFFAYMKDGPMWGRVATVASALPLAVVMNSIRVLLIALVGEFFGDDAMHAFHDWSGYIMLVVAFVVLEYISRGFGCRKFRSMQ